jgi:hypothetical protein
MIEEGVGVAECEVARHAPHSVMIVLPREQGVLKHQKV